MDKEIILNKFKNAEEARSLANNSASLLKFTDDTLYINFMEYYRLINIDQFSPYYYLCLFPNQFTIKFHNGTVEISGGKYIIEGKRRGRQCQ